MRSASTSLICTCIEVHGRVDSSQDLSVPTGRTPTRRWLNWLQTKQHRDRCHHQAIPKDHFEKSIRWRPLGWLFQNQLKARGLHPLGAPSVHLMNHLPREAECWSLKHTTKLRRDWPMKKHKWKIKVISANTWSEDLQVDCLQKSTQSSGATPIGCTFGAPNEIRVLKNQNADL